MSLLRSQPAPPGVSRAAISAFQAVHHRGRACGLKLESAGGNLASPYLARLLTAYAREQRARSRRVAAMLGALVVDPKAVPRPPLELTPPQSVGVSDRDIILDCRHAQTALRAAYDELLDEGAPKTFEHILRAQRAAVARVESYLVTLGSYSAGR